MALHLSLTPCMLFQLRRTCWCAALVTFGHHIGLRTARKQVLEVLRTKGVDVARLRVSMEDGRACDCLA